MSAAYFCRALARRDPAFAGRGRGGPRAAEGPAAEWQTIALHAAGRPAIAAAGLAAGAGSLICLFECIRRPGSRNRRPDPRAWLYGLALGRVQFNAGRAGAAEDLWIQAVLALALAGGCAAKLWRSPGPGPFRALAAFSLVGYGLASAACALANGPDLRARIGAAPGLAQAAFAALLAVAAAKMESKRDVEPRPRRGARARVRAAAFISGP